METDNKESKMFDSEANWFIDTLFNELEKKKPLEEYTENDIKKIVKCVWEEFTPAMANNVFKTLKDGMASKIEERQLERAEFKEHIRKVWGNPLDLFEIFLEICTEIGMLFNENIGPHFTSENKYLYQVLIRLYARGCQIGEEILTLLKNGFADGAYARWRTLYEIVVVAYFISENGNDVAEKYIRYDAIEAYDAMKAYRKCYQKLGYKPLTEEEIDEVTGIVDDLSKRFGENFRNKYGWASNSLNKKNPNFADIENKTNFGHMRAHYKLANHNIHAGPHGITFRLGTPKKKPGVIYLIPGPSDAGFVDPIDCTALSLYQLTTALVTTGIRNNPISHISH